MGDIILVAAVSENGVIGKDGSIPWDIKKDFQHFQHETIGHPVLMGRRTYESIPEKNRPLKNRENIVLSRNREYDPHTDVKVYHSLESALDAYQNYEQLSVIGGERVYELAMPYADRLEITRVHRNVEGEAHFPTIDDTVWKLIHHIDETEGVESFSYLTYIRK